MSLELSESFSAVDRGRVHPTQADAQLTSDQVRLNYLYKDFTQIKVAMVADGT